MSEPQWKRTERTSRNKIQSSVFRSNTSLLNLCGDPSGGALLPLQNVSHNRAPTEGRPYMLIRRTWLNSAHSSTIVMASHT